MAALSFCTTARSSAMVLEARTLRMNCFTVASSRQLTHLLFDMCVVAYSIGVRTGAHIAASNSLSFVLILLLQPFRDSFPCYASSSSHYCVGIQVVEQQGRRKGNV
jgi:hypothetical protein